MLPLLVITHATVAPNISLQQVLQEKGKRTHLLTFMRDYKPSKRGLKDGEDPRTKADCRVPLLWLKADVEAGDTAMA